MSPRQNWPSEGNADYSVGQSRLANVLGTLKKTLFGGVEAIKQDANSKVEGANDKAVDYLLSSSTDTETAGIEGSIDATLAASIVTEALKYVPKSEGGTSSKNIPYHWAGKGPGGCSGIRSHGAPEDGSYSHSCCFDCSGFTSYIYKKAVDIHIPAQSQSICDDKQGRDIFTNPSASELKSDKVLPGDVVLFRKSGASATHHVAICVGDGSGDMIEAPSTGDHVKKSSILSRHDTYKIRRFLPETAYVSSNGSVSGSTDGVPKSNEIKEEWRPIIKKWADEYKIPPAYICAVIQHESNWNADAENKNSNGTIDWGLAQINDGGKHELGPSLKKPDTSIRRCAKHIRSDADYIKTHGSRVAEDWNSKTWIMNLYRAYNAGQGGWSNNPNGLPERGEDTWKKYQKYLKKIPKTETSNSSGANYQGSPVGGH